MFLHNRDIIQIFQKPPIIDVMIVQNGDLNKVGNCFLLFSFFNFFCCDVL